MAPIPSGATDQNSSLSAAAAARSWMRLLKAFCGMRRRKKMPAMEPEDDQRQHQQAQLDRRARRQSQLALNGTLSQLTAKKNQALVPTKASFGRRMASR